MVALIDNGLQLFYALCAPYTFPSYADALAISHTLPVEDRKHHWGTYAREVVNLALQEQEDNRAFLLPPALIMELDAIFVQAFPYFSTTFGSAKGTQQHHTYISQYRDYSNKVCALFDKYAAEAKKTEANQDYVKTIGEMQNKLCWVLRVSVAPSCFMTPPTPLPLMTPTMLAQFSGMFLNVSDALAE
ncbi:hypothetical protein EIP86_005782, partial [Pleurotus ostreatoroseus]